jgi:uncharacterized protein
MNAVFADTFYWIAFTDPDDSLYKHAVELEAALRGSRIVTTDEVLTEFLTFFSGHEWLRRRAAATVRALLQDANVEVVPQSRESFQEGFDLYAARPDKRYSLTDCISMATMLRHNIKDVLTADRHCSHEGFRYYSERLLRSMRFSDAEARPSSTFLPVCSSRLARQDRRLRLAE